MNLKILLCSSAFMMSLALIVALITNFTDLFPGDVLTSDIRSTLTIFMLAVMMTISLSRIPSMNLSPKGNVKSITRAIVLGLFVSSIIPIIGYFILKGNPDYAKYATGWVFIAAAPFAASVAPLSFILRGDLEHALRSTIYVYIASLLWIPFIIWALLGEMVDMGNVIVTVFQIIGVPLILSRFLTKVKINKETMAIVLNLIIFLLVWLSVSSTNFKGIGLSIIVVFIIIALLRTFMLGGTVEIIERRAHIPWPQRVTDVLITSYKNKGIAIALCVAILAPLGPEILSGAMVAITISIVVEICWVVFMDSVLFSKKRMERELKRDSDLNLHNVGREY